MKLLIYVKNKYYLKFIFILYSIMENPVFYGTSTRLPYDECAFAEKVQREVSPLAYRLSPDQIYNGSGCLSTFGPRSSGGGKGVDVSRIKKTGFAPSQDLVDLESQMSGRNTKRSKCKSGEVIPLNMRHHLYDQDECNTFLSPEATRLILPSMMFRGARINRFINLPRDPQANIYWDQAVNSRLEAKDNFKVPIPMLWADRVSPQETFGNVQQCNQACGLKNGNYSRAR
jgi:hypothetical protein